MFRFRSSGACVWWATWCSRTEPNSCWPGWHHSHQRQTGRSWNNETSRTCRLLPERRRKATGLHVVGKWRITKYRYDLLVWLLELLLIWNQWFQTESVVQGLCSCKGIDLEAAADACFNFRRNFVKSFWWLTHNLIALCMLLLLEPCRLQLCLLSRAGCIYNRESPLFLRQPVPFNLEYDLRPRGHPFLIQPHLASRNNLGLLVWQEC